MSTENITQERAAQRFHQIRTLSKARTAKEDEISKAKNVVKTLEKERDGIDAKINEASRDEGDLPLFDLSDLS